MTSITPTQIASTTTENLIFNHEDQLQTKFAYYDHKQGTKYKKTNCALLIGSAGIIGGCTVATLVDPATRNDILKGVGAGVASSMLYLWASVSSLKPITKRGISYVQTQIKQTLHLNLIEKTNICKNVEEITDKLQQIEPKAIVEQQELTSKAQQTFKAETAKHKEKFNELTAMLGSYLAIRGLATDIYKKHANYNTTERPRSTNPHSASNHSANDNTDKYIKAATSFCVFVNKGSNDWQSKIILLDSLKPCLNKSEITAITSLLDIYPEPPRLYRPIGPNENIYKKLKIEKQNLNSRALKLKDKIETLQKKHGIEVNDDGKIVFPNLQEFAASLPK